MPDSINPPDHPVAERESPSWRTRRDRRNTRERGTVRARGASVAKRLRRHRAVALRAGAGAAVLLGVTAAVDGIANLGVGPAPAAALAEGAGAAAPVDPPAGADPTAPLAGSEATSERDPITDQADVATRQVAGVQALRAVTQTRAQANRRARQEPQQAAARRAALQVAQQAAARKAAAAAARARQTAAQQDVSRSSVRDPRSAARAMLAARGWSGQFGCLDALWQRESGWDPRAYNASSGAFGIPQALPGSKMASAGADWRTNPVTQIRWGLDYIGSTYGTPCGAWGHSQAYGWY